MDYKYIEQLVERYFQCETSLQEEQILKTFFAQQEQDVPQQLRQYIPLFQALDDSHAQLADDFDERILELTCEPRIVKARTIGIGERLRPLLRAAAIVGVVFTIGTAVNLPMKSEQAANDEINYSAYKDTYEDPTMAYDKVEDALQLLSEGFIQARMADSLRIDSLYSEVK
jgi:hypothetical protein